MRSIRTLGVGLGLVGAVAGGQVALASAADASCYGTYLCLYQNSNFGGGSRSFSNQTGQTVLINLTPSSINFNDQMSSWISLRSQYSRWYFDINGGGTGSRGPRCMWPNWQVSAVTAAENDQASS